VFYGGLRWNFRHWHMFSSVPGVNRGKTGKMRVDTPENWRKVCLIFGRDCLEIVYYTDPDSIEIMIGNYKL